MRGGRRSRRSSARQGTAWGRRLRVACGGCGGRLSIRRRGTGRAEDWARRRGGHGLEVVSRVVDHLRGARHKAAGAAHGEQTPDLASPEFRRVVGWRAGTSTVVVAAGTHCVTGTHSIVVVRDISTLPDRTACATAKKKTH